MSLQVEPDLRTKPAARRAALALLAFSAFASTLAPLAACSSTERDRYYSSRSLIIPAQPGDRSTTLAAWPYGQSAQPAATARAGSILDTPE